MDGMLSMAEAELISVSRIAHLPAPVNSRKGRLACRLTLHQGSEPRDDKRINLERHS
jgi:hypothetical protein